jgi:hypothetical protein
MASSPLFIPDDSSEITSFEDTQSSATPTQNPFKRQKTRGPPIRDHKLWEHTRLYNPLNNEQEKDKTRRIMYCKHCTNPTYKTVANITFRNHLNTQHNILIPLLQEADFFNLPSTPTSQNSSQLSIHNAFSNVLQQNTKRANTTLKQNINTKATLITLITQHNLPSTIVEWPEFRQLVYLANPFILKASPRSHNTISSKIELQFNLQQQIIM